MSLYFVASSAPPLRLPSYSVLCALVPMICHTDTPLCWDEDYFYSVLHRCKDSVVGKILSQLCFSSRYTGPFCGFSS